MQMVKAVGDNDIGNVRQLLRLHPSLASAKECDWTVLFIAAGHGNEAMMTCLLKNGANVDATDALDMTCLYQASRNGNLPVVKFLVEHCADVEIASMGGTPLFIAAHNGCKDVVKYLIESARADMSDNMVSKCGPFGFEESLWSLTDAAIVADDETRAYLQKRANAVCAMCGKSGCKLQCGRYCYSF
jgi:ankyrin repeat protein